jgi:hypothetical protein
MYYNINNQNRTRSNARPDRFGNMSSLKLAGEKIDKKSGGTISNVYSCYVEIGGKLYQIEASPSNKQTRDGRNAIWIKVTRKDQQRSNGGRL